MPGWLVLPVYEGTGLTPLWNLAEPLFKLLPVGVRVVLMAAVVSAGAIYFNLLLNRFEVLYRNSYLPAFFYTLLSVSLPSVVSVHPLHFINLILIFLLNQFFQSYKHAKPLAQLFNAGFLAALCCLIYLPLLPLLLFCILALPVLRSFNVREIVAVLVGMTVPIYLISAWWFPVRLSEELIWLNRYLLQFRFHWDITLNIQARCLGLLMALLFALSAIRLRQHYYKNIIRTRLYQQSIFLLLTSLSLTLVFSSMLELNAILLLILPLSVFYSYYFVSAKKRLWLYELIVLVLIAVVIWNRFLPSLP
jgi:hypothetical protein